MAGLEGKALYTISMIFYESLYDNAALIKNIIESDQINEFRDNAYISEEYLEINNLNGGTMNELRLHSY